MPRHHTRIKKLARLKAAADQTPYKDARRALRATAAPDGPGAVPERFTAPAALAAALRARPVIGVVSSAGGAGVSVLAVNLALALAATGQRVLVLDTEDADQSPWRKDDAILRALSDGRISAAQVSYKPFLPDDSPLADAEPEEGFDDDPHWYRRYLPDLAPRFDPDAVPQMVGDGGELLPLDPGLIKAHNAVVIDASRLSLNHAGDLLAGYAGALVTPLRLHIDQLAAYEDDWEDEDVLTSDEDEDDDEGEYDVAPRLGEPFTAPEVVRRLLRSRAAMLPPHLSGTGLAVVEPPAHDEFRLDPGFPAEFDRLVAQSLAPVVGQWIPCLPQPQETRLALAAPDSPAAAAYARLAELLRAGAA